MTIYSFTVTDGDPNTDTSKVNKTQPAATSDGAGPSAAERAAEGMAKYNAYREQNAATLQAMKEREMQRHEDERLQKQLRRRNLSHKDIFG
ncbi:hypothetical protein [Marivita sp.]|uniref:hypothetical protein n=1 Tax=Marivita sp. TaxID=2003365 RepID=UPI003F723DDA